MGFYEWKNVGKEKRPYLIGMANGEPFTLAGLGLSLPLSQPMPCSPL